MGGEIGGRCQWSQQSCACGQLMHFLRQLSRHAYVPAVCLCTDSPRQTPGRPRLRTRPLARRCRRRGRSVGVALQNVPAITGVLYALWASSVCAEAAQRRETHLLVGPRIQEEVWVAGARILRFALQVLSVVCEGRGCFFKVGCGCQSVMLAGEEAGWRIQSLPRSIFLFMEKMVSIICCCWPAIATAGS